MTELIKETLLEVRRAKKKGAWDYDCVDFPREDWRYDVEVGDTQLGYFDWVIRNLEIKQMILRT